MTNTRYRSSTHPNNENSDISKVRFDLTDLYSGIDDPQIQKDLTDYDGRTAAIKSKFKGKLSELPTASDNSVLGDAIVALSQAEEIGNKLWAYILLTYSCNQADEKVKSLRSQVEERFAKANGDLAFFDIELCTISEDILGKLLAADGRVRFHAPFIKNTRRFEKHNLSEEVERALSLRSPFGPSAISDYVEEQIAGLTITVTAKTGSDSPTHTATFEEALSLLSSPDRNVRAATMTAINNTLAEKIVPLSALTLNLIAGKKSVEDAERHYGSPMAARDLSNQISPKVVLALHTAVKNKGTTLAKRFYRLLAQQLGLPKLAWSDRNAPIKKTDEKVEWSDAVKIVLAAYNSFSPTLAKLISEMIDSGRLDAPTYKNKQTGAFNLSLVLPPPLGARSYNLLNYTGKLRDVAVFAHEAGHAVHGVLAGQAQGPLMARTPTAYAETASVFGEMVTFESLFAQVHSSGDKLSLLMGKLGDFMNTVVRQIAFSCFEQKLHAQRAVSKLSPDQITKIWRDTTTEFYGADGEVFEYRDMDNLWAYISHFHNPFYVYSYAFGELLTQSLYAERPRLGDKFESLYLDMLRAGGTKDAVELLKPFNLNPEDPAFWERGIAASAERWIAMAEKLAAEG